MILAQLADPQIGFQNYEAELQRFRNEINLIQQSDCQVAVICGDLMHHVNRESLEVYLQELKKQKMVMKLLVMVYLLVCQL